jgi:hypothetical protein
MKLEIQVETGQSMKIRGYPSLKLFKDRMQYEYNGPRSIEAMKKFCSGKRISDRMQYE